MALTLTLLTASAARTEKCEWCVQGNPAATVAALALGKLEPAEMLKSVRKQGICVRILDSGRRAPPGTFLWSTIEQPSGKLSDITKIPGLMGKTLCADELPIAKGCPTIVLASDGMKTTLVHEFLHVKQIAKDQAWCPLSKKTWETGKTSPEEQRVFLNREWDVHRWLLENLDALRPNIDDKIGIVSNTMDQARMRASFDADAAQYVEKMKLNEKLNGYVNEYTELLKASRAAARAGAGGATGAGGPKPSASPSPKPSPGALTEARTNDLAKPSLLHPNAKPAR